MANLFPLSSITTVQKTEDESKNELKGSYAFDFEKGEFIKNADGTIKVLDLYESYVQWCKKAMLTDRYSCNSYSSIYGKDTIPVTLDKKAIELEIIRITTECLMVHPATKSVSDFTFDWDNEKHSELYFTYVVNSTFNKESVLNSTMKVR